jgi:hypothetical protein
VTTGKVLKERRAPRERGRMESSLTSAAAAAAAAALPRAVVPTLDRQRLPVQPQPLLRERASRLTPVLLPRGVPQQRLLGRALHAAARAIPRRFRREKGLADDAAAVPAAARAAAAAAARRRGGVHQVFLPGFRDRERVLLVLGHARRVLLHAPSIEDLEAIDARESRRAASRRVAFDLWLLQRVAAVLALEPRHRSRIARGRSRAAARVQSARASRREYRFSRSRLAAPTDGNFSRHHATPRRGAPETAFSRAREEPRLAHARARRRASAR